MDLDLEHIQNVGIGAAYGSARILRDHLGHLESVEKKGPEDLVTTADWASERQILDTIRSHYGDHGILAEESGDLKNKSSRYQWIVDPLDGTTNFAHQLPIFSVSIAFAEAGQILVGVVLNPMTGELFTAIKGRGAARNGQAMSPSACGDLSESLLVTGFPYDVKSDMAPYMQRFSRCLQAAVGVRRLGSAALDLCFVACGRFEGFWEENLKPWDTAAGALIAEEAGGRVTDFAGNGYTVEKKQILATNGHIHDPLRAILNQ
ncbi:MAG: inositol monophosphatase family protein [Thermodesulfobacteriota bacterium]